MTLLSAAGTPITRRKALQYGGAAAIALSATGSAIAAPKRGGKLRVGKAHGGTTDTLDPATFENGFTISLTNALHNYLTEVGPDGALRGEMAESWEASSDAKTWTFKLRDAKFHNGKKVTAKDVIASLNHHRGEDSKSAAKPIVEPITEIKAKGDNAVEITLSDGNADFPYIVSDYHLAIGPAEDDGTVDWTKGIGAGGYKLDNYEPGVRADFTRNDDYWKKDSCYFDSLELLSIVDPVARTNALVTGEVDVIDRVPLKTVSLLKRKSGVKVLSTNGTQHYTFPMDTRAAPFKDNHVRLALKYAIDREELVEKILFGYGSAGNDHPIGRGQPFFAKDLGQRTYDPDKAKFHLKKAGMDSLTVPLSVADAAFEGAGDAGALFQASAKKAGIEIDLIREPNDGYWSNVWMTKPFCACYWSGRPTSDWMFSTAYAEGVPWNDAYWEHTVFNVLLKAARSELDEDRRRDMYSEMQEIVSDEGGTIIPMFAQYVFATSDKVAQGDTMGTNWDMDGERYMERWWFA